MKATHFYVVAGTAIVSLLATFGLIFDINFNQRINGSTSSQMASISTAELSTEIPSIDASSIESGYSTSNTMLIPNDPFFSKQWALEKINATALWSNISGITEVMVAVLDTGIDADHEDLQGKIVAEVNFSTSSTSDDINGHGTHIAGIICATSSNSTGITGFAPGCKIMNVKVADDQGFCNEAAVAQGILWSVDHGAKIINISLEIRNPSIAVEQAINYAWDHGVLIIAAAGNQGNSSAIYPAYYENSIAVAATRPDDTLAPLSNFGDWVDVAAPGFNIYSTLPDNKYGYETGTSFATAYVSGLAAILFGIISDSNGNGLSNDEVRNIIESSCRQIHYANYVLNVIDASACLQKNLAIKP